MPPRLAHKKTRSGCKRCKARKVKCDEVKPQCTACTRHGVTCEYPDATHGDHRSPSQDTGADHSHHELELRLMHEWMAYTSETLSTTIEFWKIRAPLLALQHRFVFEALLALSALHASRQEAKAWSGIHGREVPVGAEKISSSEHSPAPPAFKEWKGWRAHGNHRLRELAGTGSMSSPTQEDRRGMLEVSRKYFSCALEGQQKAVASLSVETIGSTYLCSMLVNYYSLFTLSEEDDDIHGHPVGITNWIRLSRGIRLIISQMPLMSKGPLQAESMHGEPDLSDMEELFHPAHMEPFKYLLTNVNGDEIAEEDRETFEHTLSYVGLIYKGIVQRLDSPLAIGRRVNAFPAAVPMRFLDFVEARHPRAMAIVAHVFASMELAQEQYPWFKGIGMRQIPIICRSLPQEWAEFVQWPQQIAQGSATNVSRRFISANSTPNDMS